MRALGERVSHKDPGFESLPLRIRNCLILFEENEIGQFFHILYNPLTHTTTRIHTHYQISSRIKHALFGRKRDGNVICGRGDYGATIL